MPCSAFGLSLDFEPQPPGAWRPAIAHEPAVAMRLAPVDEVEGRWSGGGEVGWEAEIDGARFQVERGVAGDHRFRHGAGLTAQLSSGGDELLCAIGEPSDPLAWRAVLDSVLFSVSLLAGFEALHAGAVVTESGVVAITAGPGGGKSTLLAELIASGAELFSDDVVVLEGRAGGEPLAHPGPPLMTVPSDLEPLPGDGIAELGSESWRAVPTHSAALPLSGLVLLNRQPGLDTELRSVDNPLGLLMTSLLKFPQSPERERARFEIAAEIASHVPVWELRADPAVEPSTLATVLRPSDASP